MPTFRLIVALALVGLLLPSTALACLWDYDTLLQERSRFPDTLELITGKFLRHSEEFYQWRIQDRLQKLHDDPDNLANYDDLAVAYEKTGQHQKAIETMQAKDRRKPGLYETEANLGTFCIHAGQLEEGLKHINRAIEINPDAHFGREKYQKLLVEYLLDRRRNGIIPLPLAMAGEEGNAYQTGNHSFSSFLKGKHKGELWGQADRQEAIKGVLGMMRFGNHESPILLEALGSLLSHFPRDVGSEDAKQMAARAYLMASYAVPDEAAKRTYREMARQVLMMQSGTQLIPTALSLEQLEAEFQAERAEAQGWYDVLRQNELTWIREGKDPEEEFNRLYSSDPQVSVPPIGTFRRWASNAFLAVAAGSALLALVLFIRKRSRRRGISTSANSPT